MVEDILNEEQINNFLSNIECIFPNFVAGIITDRHGFTIGMKKPPNFHIHETNMALYAITSKKNYIEDSRFLKIKRNLDKSRNFKLLLLLEKSNNYVNRFKKLRNIIETQSLF